MNMALQIAGVAVVTTALFFASAPAVARGLRLNAGQVHLAAMGVRFVLVVLLALALLFSGLEHRVALVFTVGAASFASAVIDGVRQFRRRTSRNREVAG